MPTEGDYYEGCNQWLLRAVPEESERILEVGCGAGRLGAALKELRPGRVVFGIERESGPAAEAGRSLDGVFCIDVEHESPALPPASLDCILYGDVLEHLHNPGAVLERHRALLRPNGVVVCSIPNLQHHSVVSQLLRGDFQYQDRGLLDETHLRFFTFATALKLLLDAGYAPDIVDGIEIPGADPLVEAAGPLLDLLRADPGRTRRYMNTQQMIVLGRPAYPSEPDLISAGDTSLTFVANVNDESQLQNNLLRSPVIRDGNHEVLLFRHQTSAAEGFNAGIAQALNDLVVLVHQDVYLPKGWDARLIAQWHAAKSGADPVGVAGVVGVGDRRLPKDHLGRVVDRDSLLDTGNRGPEPVDGLDELLLVVPRDTSLRVDPNLGWHLYGTDLCLQAQRAGLGTVVLDALCHHNSLIARPPATYWDSARALAHKWPDLLPINTNSATIDASLLAPPARSGLGASLGSRLRRTFPSRGRPGS